jgi:non-heme chloroperoxidase
MSHFLTRDHTKIVYRDIGKGDPVILIHGWPLCSAMWEYQSLALLEEGKRVITYDRRGFGKSDQPALGYDYDTLASDVNDLITHLSLSTVSLVGFSMGGGEIARYLTRYGSTRVSKVALISSVVPYMLKTDTNPNGVPKHKFDEMKDAIKHDRPKFLGAFAKDFYGASLMHSAVSEEMILWTNFLAFQAGLKSTLDCVDAFGKTDFRSDLKSFTMPTLIIHGTADKTVPIKTAGEAAARGIANSIYRPIEGAPHGLFITHKNQLNEELTAFLR